MNAKQKSVLDRIRHLEEAITKAREYLATGADADWRGFRSLFVTKMRAGKALPPHKDWVQNVFLPRRERALRSAEKLLENLKHSSADKDRSRRRQDGLAALGSAE